jgi:PTH1 family peptidyl-tRNA hydrolase
LLKPQTFMNLSWESVRKIVDFYKIDIKDFIVVYDDLSMDFWKVRFREKWSAWWHNWVKDIIKHFWDQFDRIKVWIWFNQNYEVSDWVLSKFKDEELDELDDKVFWEVFDLLLQKI